MIALASVSCNENSMEGPFGGLVVHEESGIDGTSVVFSDGRISSDGSWVEKPVASVTTDGSLEYPLYVTWSLDGGDPVTQGPFDSGKTVKYDLGDTPLAPGEHTVVGDVSYTDVLGQKQVVKEFADRFNVAMDYKPDFQFSVVRDGVETPVYTYIPVELSANASYQFQCRAGGALVNFKTIDFSPSVVDFTLVARVETVEKSYIPFVTKAAGKTTVSVRIMIGDKSYTPVFNFIVKEN